MSLAMPQSPINEKPQIKKIIELLKEISPYFELFLLLLILSGEIITDYPLRFYVLIIIFVMRDFIKNTFSTP